jgi:hypothetical protein
MGSLTMGSKQVEICHHPEISVLKNVSTLQSYHQIPLKKFMIGYMQCHTRE